MRTVWRNGRKKAATQDETMRSRIVIQRIEMMFHPVNERDAGLQEKLRSMEIGNIPSEHHTGLNCQEPIAKFLVYISEGKGEIESDRGMEVCSADVHKTVFCADGEIAHSIHRGLSRLVWRCQPSQSNCNCQESVSPYSACVGN